MFVPPDRRHPDSSPWNEGLRKPSPAPRGERLGLWLIGLLLLSLVLAPLGGSTVLEAVWSLLRR